MFESRLVAFVLVFSINTVSSLDSSFFKAVLLYVAKILQDKHCDLISASYPLACYVLEGALLSQVLYSVGLCLDFLCLEAVG